MANYKKIKLSREYESEAPKNFLEAWKQGINKVGHEFFDIASSVDNEVWPESWLTGTRSQITSKYSSKTLSSSQKQWAFFAKALSMMLVVDATISSRVFKSCLFRTV